MNILGADINSSHLPFADIAGVYLNEFKLVAFYRVYIGRRICPICFIERLNSRSKVKILCVGFEAVQVLKNG